MIRSGPFALLFGSLVLLAVAALAGLPGLGDRDFWPQDEARYGTVALEMWNGAHPAVPHLNGKVYQDKPPGFFWLVNAAAMVRGQVDEWAARVPSVLGAALLAIGAYWMLAPLAGAGAGLVAGMFALATFLLAWESRQAHLDALFGGFVALGMAAFTRALEPGRERMTLLGWLLIGCAVLVKGPLALLAPATFMVAALLLRRPGAFFNRFLVGGLLLTVLPSLVWLGWAYVHLNGVKDGSGLEYVQALFRDQIADRVDRARAHEQPWHFYLRVLPLGFLPFFPIVLLGLAPGVRKSLGPAKAPLVVAACWLVLAVAIQSAFPGKRLLYCVPLVAPFAVICAAVLSSEARGALGFASGWVAFIGCLVFIAGGVLVTAGFDEWTYTEGRRLAEERIVDSLTGDSDDDRPPETGVASRPVRTPGEVIALQRAAELDWLGVRRGALLCGIAAMVLSAIGLTALALGANRAGSAWTAGAVAGFVGLACGLVLPHLDPLISRRPAAEAARAAAEAAGPEGHLAFMSHIDEAFPFYTGRPVTELVRQKPKAPADQARARDLAAKFLAEKGSVLVARRSDVANLRLEHSAKGGVSGPLRAGGQQFFILRGPR